MTMKSYVDIVAEKGLSLDRLASLVRFADTGSIVAAARRGASGPSESDAARQSLISRQLRELGQFFGTELVRRKGRGLELTEAGRELAALAREHFKGLSDFAADRRDEPVGFSIAAPQSILQWLVIPQLPAIMEAHPGIRWSLIHESTREIARAVGEGQYDWGIMRESDAPSTLERRRLGFVRWTLYVPEELRADAKAVLAGRIGFPLALPIGGEVRRAIDAWLTKKGGMLATPIDCTSYMQGAEALRTGRCAAILPHIAARSLAPLGVREIALPIPSLRKPIALIWSRRMVATRPAAEGVLRTLAKLLGIRG
jgi:DNA-binding transcriptional LysR family regulator